MEVMTLIAEPPLQQNSLNFCSGSAESKVGGQKLMNHFPLYYDLMLAASEFSGDQEAKKLVAF